MKKVISLWNPHPLQSQASSSRLPMRLLFVKLKHIGDALLMTPVLTAVRQAYPDAEIWVVARRGCESILDGCVAIDRLLVAPAPEKRNRTPGTWKASLSVLWQLRKQKFDQVFEFSDGDRGRWMSVLARAKHRSANAGVFPLSRFWRLFFDQVSDFHWLGMHSVEKDYRTVSAFLPLPDEIPPLSFARERMKSWAPGEAIEDFAFLHPATRWQRKRWPEKNWFELGEVLLGRVSRLIIGCGPDPEEIEATRALCEKLGDRALFTGGNLEWSQVAWLMSRARLFVGVDTAAMHLAAACQCPTVAIFGPSVPWTWRPWRVACKVIAPESHEIYSGRIPEYGEIAELKTSDVAVKPVLEACEELLDRGRDEPVEAVEASQESSEVRSEQ
jgi:heptosyltransferase III